MPAPRGFTAASQAVRDVADKALESPEGVTLQWLTKDYGLRACEYRSRSFQVTFCSLRARSRRQRLNHHKDEPTFALDLQSRGLYDRLACERDPLPDGAGWTIRLCKADDLLDGVTIIDNATGEPLAKETPDQRRFRHFIDNANTKPDAVTADDFAWAERHAPGTHEYFRPWFERMRPDLYSGHAANARVEFVGQDALLDELGDDAFAEIPNEGEEGA